MKYVSRNKDGSPRKPKTCPLMTKACVDCGEGYLGVYNQKRCRPCRAAREMPKPRRNPSCLLCAKDLADQHPNTKFCGNCVATRRRAYWLAGSQRNDNNAARLLTKYAVKLGLLPDPRDFVCVDCKRRPAECYDHRDYSKPLNVDPVCLRCNSSRGKGVAVHFPCVEYVASDEGKRVA